eukprot:Clim_evm6s229 gene=Clim_evmTU6s229
MTSLSGDGKIKTDQDLSFFAIKAIEEIDELKEAIDFKKVEWVRAEEVLPPRNPNIKKSQRPCLFQGKIEPNDIRQGKLGDCWLLAALSALAEHPASIRNVFETRERSIRGKYNVRLYDVFKKRFRTYTVDSYIPVIKKRPIFTSPNGRELWVLMLEKAMAKYFGSCAALNGGWEVIAWRIITGDHCFRLKYDRDRKTWYRADLADPKPGEDFKFYKRLDEEYADNQLWVLLSKYDRNRAVMSCATDHPDEVKMAQLGIITCHAYTLLNVHSFNKGKIKLVELRNPHGDNEWKGDWSDDSPIWKKHPNIAKKVKMQKANDGRFFMAYKDFLNVFTSVAVCDRTSRGDVCLDINEDNYICGPAIACCFGCTKFWLLCKGCRTIYLGRDSSKETLDATKKRGALGLQKKVVAESYVREQPV